MDIRHDNSVARKSVRARQALETTGKLEGVFRSQPHHASPSARPHHLSTPQETPFRLIPVHGRLASEAKTNLGTHRRTGSCSSCRPSVSQKDPRGKRLATPLDATPALLRYRGAGSLFWRRLRCRVSVDSGCPREAPSAPLPRSCIGACGRALRRRTRGRGRRGDARPPACLPMATTQAVASRSLYSRV